MQSLSSHLADNEKDLFILHFEKKKKYKNDMTSSDTHLSLSLHLLSSPQRLMTRAMTPLLSFMVL